MAESTVEEEQEPSTKEKEASQENSMNAAVAHPYIVLKTTGFVLVFVCLGLIYGITGVTQLDLRDGLGEDVTMEDLSLAQSMKSVGVMVGGLLGSVVIDRFHRHADLIMSGACVLGAVTTFLLPLVQYLEVFALLSFLDGVAGVHSAIVCTMLVLVLWGDNADAPMQVLHFGFGIGFTVAPLLGKPFISPDEEEDSNSSESGGCNDDLYNTTSCESRIVIPYTIISLVTFLMGITFLIFYIAPVPKGLKLFSLPKSSWKDVLRPGSCANGNGRFAVGFITILALFYFCIIGKNIALSKFLFSFAVEGDLDFSKDEAAMLDFVNKLCVLIGRGVASLLALVISIHPLIFTEVFGSALLAVGLCTLGTQDKTWLWVFSCLYTFVGTPIYPSGYSWADKYITVYAIVLAIIELSTGVAGFSCMWLTGFLYTNVSPESTMYLTMIFSLCLCLLLVIGQVLGSKNGNRFSQKTNILEESVNDESVVVNQYDNPTIEISGAVESTNL